jgi:hypothetical protein
MGADSGWEESAEEEERRGDFRALFFGFSLTFFSFVRKWKVEKGWKGNTGEGTRDETSARVFSRIYCSESLCEQGMAENDYFPLLKINESTHTCRYLNTI